MGQFLFFILVCVISCVPISHAVGSDIFLWQSSNVQFLRGHDFELGEEQRSIVTLEHAHSHVYGDTFAFLDVIKPDGEDRDYYLEISPRLSLSKMSGVSISNQIIKDILISTTFEKAKDQGPQYLYGVAVDLNVPNFKFFKVNAYIHDSTELTGDTWQVTLAWNKSFNLGDLKFLAEGFADFQGGEGGRHSNQLVVPRLLWDMSDVLGYSENTFMVGLEYSYWHNKFGLKGVTESVPQLQAKWSF